MAQGMTNASTGLGNSRLPDWWMERRTLVAGERIEQYAPIEYRQYNASQEINAHLMEGFLPATKTASMSKDERYILIMNDTAPYIHFYMKNDESDVSYTAMTGPEDLPEGIPDYAELSEDGQFMVVCCQTSPYIFLYRITDGVLSRLPNPDIPLSAYATSAKFAPDSSCLVVRVYNLAPAIYRFEDGALTKVATTLTLAAPNLDCNTFFSPDAKILVVNYPTGSYSTSKIEFAVRREDGAYELKNDTDLFDAVPASYIGSTTYKDRYQLGFTMDGEYLVFTSKYDGTSCPATSSNNENHYCVDSRNCPGMLYQRREDGIGYDLRAKIMKEVQECSVNPNGSLMVDPRLFCGAPILSTAADRLILYGGNAGAGLKIYKKREDGVWDLDGPISMVPALSSAVYANLSIDGDRLYVFTNDAAYPLLRYDLGTRALALNMRDARLCKTLALDGSTFYGMGIALSAANEGEEFQAGMFTPINDTIGGASV